MCTFGRICSYLHHFKHPYHFFIRRQPLHHAELFLCKPSCRLMFQQRKASVHHSAKIAMHSKMKLRVIILYGREKLTNRNVCRQFFTNLPTKRLFLTLFRFHLTARELSPVFPLAITSLSGKKLAAIADDSSNNFNTFSYFHFLTLHLRNVAEWADASAN